MAEALHLSRVALELLDQASAPADIGAHIDRAIIRIEELVRDPGTR